MQRSRIHQIIAISILTLACSQSYAQKIDQFLEKNLPDKSPKKTSNGVTVEDKKTTPDLQNTMSVDSIKSSIENIMLNKKAISLMFNDEQNGKIDRAVEASKTKGSETDEKLSDSSDSLLKEAVKSLGSKNEKSYIYLASMIYLNPTNWAVWINGQKITSENNKKSNELYIKSVERDRVKLLWTMSVSKWKILSRKISEKSAPKINTKNEVEIQFELKPNQTFILESNSIAEGYAFGVVKKKEEEVAASQVKENIAQDSDAKKEAVATENKVPTDETPSSAAETIPSLIPSAPLQ